MAKVNIAKLLKTKNRITAEITRVKSKMNQHNAFIVSKDVPEGSEAIQVSVPQLASELQSLTSKLVRVKSAISRANVKSVDKIFEMAEVKGQISFYNGLDCSTAHSASRYGGGENEVKRVQIKLAEREQIVTELTKMVNNLQDELDNFNATTTVEVDDDVLL